jgi:hypothetical protein
VGLLSRLRLGEPQTRPILLVVTFREQIQFGGRAHSTTIPPIVSRLLSRANDPKRTLSRAFFDLALDRERAKFFGFVTHSQTLPPSHITLLKQLLTVESRCNILGELVDASTVIND